MTAPWKELSFCVRQSLALVAITACVAAIPGCNTRPQAPALIDEPTYQNAQEGFRFLAPEGWAVHAKADVPPGKLEKERLLVLYRQKGTARDAMLQVSMVDLAESADLSEHLGKPSFGVENWARLAAPVELQVGQVPAQRIRFGGKMMNEPIEKEVVAIRREGRVYLFTILFAPAETKTRDQARKAIESVEFKKS